MARKVLEGTWEEVSGQVELLAQHRIRHARLELELDNADSDASNAVFPNGTIPSVELTAEEWIRRADQIAEQYADLPALPPEAFERDSLYEGHY